MEPITTTAAISSVVGYLAKKLKDNKSIQSFFDDFSEATVNWIKPIFIREDGVAEKTLKDLQEKPDSIARQEAAVSSIAVALEDNPQALASLQDMLMIIQQKDPTVPRGLIVMQNHSGGGDNVAGNKTVHYN